MPSFFSRIATSHTLAALTLLFATACHSRITYPPGGYPYPIDLNGNDTQDYFYPLKEKITRRDSVRNILSFDFWQSTHEPNLSLKPLPTDVFRFCYQEALNPTIYIIRIMPTSAVVRIGTPTKDYQYEPDSNRLTPIDRRLIRILDWSYPIDDKSWKNSKREHFLDSMGKLYPQLYSPSYYIATFKKEYPQSKPSFAFTSRTIPLQPVEFQHFVSLINESGYWKLPYKIPCSDPPFDGWGYSLEANTAHQYNFVGAGSCDPDTGSFAKACQALVNFAGLQKKITIVWNPTMVVDSSKHIVIEDVQLEDVKEKSPPHKPHHPKKSKEKIY